MPKCYICDRDMDKHSADPCDVCSAAVNEDLEELPVQPEEKQETEDDIIHDTIGQAGYGSFYSGDS